MDPIQATNELSFRVGFTGHSGHLRLEPLSTVERANPLRSIPDFILVSPPLLLCWLICSLAWLHFQLLRFFLLSTTLHCNLNCNLIFLTVFNYSASFALYVFSNHYRWFITQLSNYLLFRLIIWILSTFNYMFHGVFHSVICSKFSIENWLNGFNPLIPFHCRNIRVRGFQNLVADWRQLP